MCDSLWAAVIGGLLSGIAAVIAVRMTLSEQRRALILTKKLEALLDLHVAVENAYEVIRYYFYPSKPTQPPEVLERFEKEFARVDQALLVGSLHTKIVVDETLHDAVRIFRAKSHECARWTKTPKSESGNTPSDLPDRITAHNEFESSYSTAIRSFQVALRNLSN